MSMQINLTITVKKVEAKDFAEAKVKAYNELMNRAPEALGMVGAYRWEYFDSAARAAREVDGTYTVTIP